MMDDRLRPYGVQFDALRQAKAQAPNDIETLTAIQRKIISRKSSRLGDEQTNKLVAMQEYLRTWEEILSSGGAVEANEVFVYNGQMYRATQAHTAQAHYPPSIYTLALYRPIASPEEQEAGTEDNPIEYINGMDVFNGKTYSYNGKLWRWTHVDTPACVWPPGTAGVWFWELLV